MMRRLPQFILFLVLAYLGKGGVWGAQETASSPPTVVKIDGYAPNNPEAPITKALAGLMKVDPSMGIEPWSGLMLPSGGPRTALMMSIAGRTAPDITLDYFSELNNDVSQGFYYPLNEWIGKDKNGDGQIEDNEATWAGWKDVPPLWREVSTVDGKVYALPWSDIIYEGIIFRTDVARRYGLDPDHPPQTWDEFYYWCQKVTGPNPGHAVPGLPPPKQRALMLTSGANGQVSSPAYLWLPWVQSDGGKPIEQIRVSPTTGKSYSFGMEATDFRTPDGEDLRAVKPTWRANFDSPEAIAATAFYHKLRWGKWMYDPKTKEPINLTQKDIDQGSVSVGDHQVKISPDDVITGVCRNDIDTRMSKAGGDPMGGTSPQVVIEPADINELATKTENTGLDPDTLSWFPFPAASSDHGQRVVQAQRHWYVMTEGVGRRPKAERDKVWEALTRMCSPEVRLYTARQKVLQGMACFVNPDTLRELGFTDSINDIPPSVRQNYEDIKTGRIGSFVEPYMGFWDPTGSALSRKVFGPMLAPTGESFDYVAALAEVTHEANTGLMFPRSSASLAPYRPFAWGLALVGMILIGFKATLIVRSILGRKIGSRISTGVGVHRRWLPWLLLAPALFIIAVWHYYPLLLGTAIAFQNYKIVGNSPFVGIDNFIVLCLDPTWWASLGRTLYFVGLNLTLAFFAPIFLALMLSEVPRGKVFYRTLFFLPHVTSGIVITLLWRIMYEPTPEGFFNQMLALLNHLPFVHIPTQTWLLDPRMAMICCVIPPIWASMGISSLLYLAALKGVPEEIYEAAEIDGAGVWHKLTKITLPTLFPLILINFLGHFIAAFNSMGDILLLTFGGPGDATMVAGMKIWIEAYNDLRFSMATSMAWMLGVFLIAFTILHIQILQRVEFKRADWK